MGTYINIISARIAKFKFVLLNKFETAIAKAISNFDYQFFFENINLLKCIIRIVITDWFGGFFK